MRATTSGASAASVVYVSGEPMAYALVTPALYVPRRHPLARGANADAAALLALYVEGAHPQHGLGKQAIQRLAAKLVDQRNINAIDAASSREESFGRGLLE